ncbi:MAG: hypothetical protein QOF61_129 [Acidobacteriota bacterium]|jgi:hypothetical protein|nr:hypothetical protein [Acidobacteriota bacterium]
MSDGNNHRHSSAGESFDLAALSSEKRRTPWGLAAVAVLFVVMPFLTWYATSYWRTLSDAQVDEYLSDTRNLRHAQHALEEIDRRIIRGDANVKRWYPRVIQVSTDEAADLRMAAAWVMGDDNREESFHAALLRLLDDQEPAVRRMAALSLSRFNEPRARAELITMLRDYAVRVGSGGKILNVLPVGSVVRRGAMIARVRTEAGEVREIRSPLAGRVEKNSAAEGASVSPDDELLVLSPDADNAVQALRALYLVGTMDELSEVDKYARGVARMPESVQKQAAQTREMIVRRAGSKL